MNPTSQAQEFFAPVQQLWSDGFSMAMEGIEVSQEIAKKTTEGAFSLAAASAKHNVKYAGDLFGHMTTAATHANAFLREQAALAADLPKDPLGASQRMLAGWLDGYQRSMSIGAEALKTYVGMLSQTWGNVEKVSQESRTIFTDCADKMQGIVEARVKKA